MPTIQISKTEFERYVGKKLPPEELKDRISFLGTDLEGIEDDVITVEVFPNRPDMLSVQGFARGFASFIGHKTGLRTYEVKESGEKVIIEKAVKDVRPFTVCALVKGITYTDEKIKEVIDIQEKLHVTYGRNRKKMAIGIYPLEDITLPITFTARKPEDIVFRPLESDSEMNAKEILEKHPTGQKYGHLLEGKKTFPVFIDAKGDVLSVPPIINSHKAGRIREDTRDVFIEASGFDYGVLARGLNMIVTAFADMGGEIYSMELEYNDGTKRSPDLTPRRMAVDPEYINKRLGLELSKKEVKKYLLKMGFGIEKDEVLVPSYRADILHQADLAEAVSIAYGYENFEEIIPKVATIARENPTEKFKSVLAQLLVGLGYLEASTYNLTNKEHQSAMMESSHECVELANAISQEYNVLRAWLLPHVIEVFSKNKHYEYPQKIFGLGRTFQKDKKEETGVREENWLCIASCHETAGYTESRQVVDYIMRSLGLDYEVKECEHPSFIPGRCAQLVLDGAFVGYFGEVSPKVLSNWQIEMPICGIELSVDGLIF